MQQSNLDTKRKKKNMIIAGVISLGIVGLTAGSIALATRVNKKSDYENQKDNYYSTSSKLEEEFYKIQTAEFRDMIQKNKPEQLKKTNDASLTWDNENTYKIWFDKLKTLVDKTLEEVQKNEEITNLSKKEEVKANMEAYKSYFASLWKWVEEKLNNEKKQLEFIKSKIEGANSKENFENLAYHNIKSLKLGKLWEKASEIKAKEEAAAGEDSEKQKAVEEKFKTLIDLFSNKEKSTIENLKEIQDEVNKIIENENEKFVISPEDEFAFKMDEFLEKEKEIELELYKGTEIRRKIASLDNSIKTNNVDNKEVNSLTKEMDNNIKKIETLVKEYKEILSKIKTLSLDIKQFELYKDEFNFTIGAIYSIEELFKTFKKEYDSKKIDYNQGLTNLAEETQVLIQQIENFE